jgi:hypothetical protein
MTPVFTTLVSDAAPHRGPSAVLVRQNVETQRFDRSNEESSKKGTTASAARGFIKPSPIRKQSSALK